MTTLPVADLSATPLSGRVIFPHFADGGGWTTQIVLTNPGDTTLSGTIQFLNSQGAPANVTISGQTNDSFSYSIPARTSQKLQTAGATAPISTGSVRVTAGNGMVAPIGVAIFSFLDNGITVTEAGVSAVADGTAFRVYAEISGAFGMDGSIRTGVAVSNNSTIPAVVTLELENLDGSSTGMTGTLSIPGNGHVSTFLTEIPGFASAPAPFKGIVRVSGASAAGPIAGSRARISVIGLRGRYNERNDFLITTTPPTNEDIAQPSTLLFFPHIVDSGGYTTQFILFNGRPAQSFSGAIELFSSFGLPLSVRFQL
jgi:hypothetical protein